MNAKFRFAAAISILLPQLAVNSGVNCTFNVPVLTSDGNDGGDGSTVVVVADTVDFVFSNETAYNVLAFVDDSPSGTTGPGGVSPPVQFDCSAGEVFKVDGDIVTGAGDFPSVNSLNLTEGTHFLCGDTVQINFFIDTHGDLALDFNPP